MSFNRISSLQESISQLDVSSSPSSSFERNALQLQLVDACNEMKESLWTALLSSTSGGPLDASVEVFDETGVVLHSPISDLAVAELLRKNFSRRPEDKLTTVEISVSTGSSPCQLEK